MNQPVKKLIEGYKPAAVPMALMAIAGAYVIWPSPIPLEKIWKVGLIVSRPFRWLPTGFGSELLDQAGIAPDYKAWRVEMTRNWGSKAEEEELEVDLYLAIE